MANDNASYRDAVELIVDDTANARYSANQIDQALRTTLHEYNLALKSTSFTIKDLDSAASTTVPTTDAPIFQLGAAGFAMLSRATSQGEVNVLQGDASNELRALGEKCVNYFYEAFNPNLSEIGAKLFLAKQQAEYDLQREEQRVQNELAILDDKQAGDIALQAAKDAAELARLDDQQSHEITIQTNDQTNKLALQNDQQSHELDLETSRQIGVTERELTLQDMRDVQAATQRDWQANQNTDQRNHEITLQSNDMSNQMGMQDDQQTHELAVLDDQQAHEIAMQAQAQTDKLAIMAQAQTDNLALKTADFDNASSLQNDQQEHELAVLDEKSSHDQTLLGLKNAASLDELEAKLVADGSLVEQKALNDVAMQELKHRQHQIEAMGRRANVMLQDARKSLRGNVKSSGAKLDPPPSDKF